MGPGYDILDRGKLKWDLTGGLGYQYTEFAEVVPGQPRSEDTATVFVGPKFDWEATDYLDVVYTHDPKVPLPATSDIISNINLELSVELTGRLDLDFNFIWDYVSNPAPAAGGVVPEQSDFRSSISLGWEL